MQDRITHENVEIIITCDNNIRISTYPKAITEAIKQMLSNSMDHGFSNIKTKYIEIKADLYEGQITLEYRDNGTGLSQKSQKELFNPFYTTMRGLNGKVGLGMYLTFNILTHLLKGKVVIGDSEKGFYLRCQFPENISNHTKGEHSLP